MSPKKTLKDAYIEYPSIEDLKKLSVKLTKFVGDEEILLGTGTIVFDGSDYYVLTAAHCFRNEDGDDNCELDDVVITMYNGEEPIEISDKKDWWKSSVKEDAAWIKIGDPLNDFDYWKDLRILSNVFEKPACVFGYVSGCDTGRRFEFTRTNTNVWRCGEGVISNGGELADTIMGLSGGGLFVKVDGVIYLMGYVKKTYDDYMKLEDVVMFPMTNYKEIDFGQYLIKQIEDVYGKPVRARECNEEKARYGEIWGELYNSIYDNKKIGTIINKIKKAKTQYPFPKNVQKQEQVISLLLRRNTKWSKSYQEAFLLALQDRGLWLSLYGEMPVLADNIKELILAKQQEERSETLTLAPYYTNTIVANSGDDAVYEKILRAAFSFDFALMKKMLKEWDAKGFWLVRRELLLNLFNKEDDSLKRIDAYLKREPNLDKKFIATVSYNLINGDIFNKRSYKDFWGQGIDSVGELLSYIAGDIDKPKEGLGVYGVHNSLLFGGEDIMSFPESLRLLQTIINTGMVPCMNFISVLSKENWMKAVRHLFHYMPYPIVFYTLTYSDEKLLRRVAQELCYTDDENIRKILPDLLLKLLVTFNNPDRPKFFWQGILYMTKEWYVAVKEEVWYPVFYKNILNYFCNEIHTENISSRDILFLNIIEAISHIKDKTHRSEVLLLLFNTFGKNPYLIGRLIQSLKVDTSLLEQLDVEPLLKNVIENYQLKDTCGVIYHFDSIIKMSEEIQAAIHANVERDDFIFGRNAGVTYSTLSYILQDQNDVNKFKAKILQMNMWDCGVHDRSLTDPNYIHLESFYSEMRWTKEEWEHIRNNMLQNIALIDADRPNLDGMIAHFNKQYIELLSNMKCFSKRISNNEGFCAQDVNEKIEKVLQKLRGYNNVMEALASEDYDKVTDGLWYLRDRFVDEGLDGCKTEIMLLINRVMLQTTTALSNCIVFLAGIVDYKPKEMTKAFGTSLLELLKKYSEDFNYEALFVNVPIVYSSLKSIAKGLSCVYNNETVVKYWNEDESVNRFDI